jgi:hypothetical protein
LTPGKAGPKREAARELMHHPAVEPGTTNYAPAVEWVEEGRVTYVWRHVPEGGTGAEPHGN